MRAVIQRVSRARVIIDGKTVGEIEGGLLVLLAVTHQDTSEQVRWMAEKTIGLRIFEDDEGKMNRSISESGGAILVVSQFTLYGDCRKGRRPSFIRSAPPEIAIPLYESYVNALIERGVHVETGEFGATMQVELTNDGPVTLILDTPE